MSDGKQIDDSMHVAGSPSGLACLLGQNGDRLLAPGYNIEVASIEGEYSTAVALGAGHDRADGEAEGEVGIARDRVPDARKVAFAAIEGVFAGFQVGEQSFQGREGKRTFDHVRRFGRDTSWDDIRATVGIACLPHAVVVWIGQVDDGIERRGIEGERHGRQCDRRYSSISAARGARGTFAMPSETKYGRP